MFHGSREPGEGRIHMSLNLPGRTEALESRFPGKASTVSSSDVDIDYGRPLRLGWFLLVVGFGGFVVWAILAPLDQGVPVSGTVVVTGNRKVVQNLSPGVVEAILVKDGDEVEAGNILVRFDATMARSQYEVARSQWLVAKAAEARLMAEFEGREEIVFPDELSGEEMDLRATNSMRVQKQLLRSRRAALQAELGAMKSSIVGLESHVRALVATLSARKEQARLLQEELKGLRDLAAEGYLPRNRLSEQERLLAQLTGARSEDLGNLERSRQNIAEIRMRMEARQHDYRREVEAELSDIQKETSGLDNRIKALAFELTNTEVRAPVAGVVVGLNVHTVGGVIAAGFSLMEVVPKNEPLKIDVEIPTTLIDKTKADLPVEIMFPAFNQRTTPRIPGRVLLVAADASFDPHGMRPPVYKGQVVVTQEGMEKLKTHEIKAGMPAEVFIKTGERTLLNYLFKPISDYMRSALTED